MKKLLIYISFVILSPLSIQAQKFVSESGYVSFFSHTPMEDISAVNKKAVSILNIETTDIVFSIPIKEFRFDQSLMEEHFNEKYMESDKYPKATFQGKVIGLSNMTIGIQQVKAIGKLMIHGVTHDVEIPGTLEEHDGKWLLKTKFIVVLKDYNVEIPQLLWQKIAEQVEVTVDLIYQTQQHKI